METNANKLVYPLNLPANEFPEALVTCWITSIGLLNCDGKYISWRMNGGPDTLSGWQRDQGEPGQPLEYYIEDRTEARLTGIKVNQGYNIQRRETAYEPVVTLRLAAVYNGRWT